MEVSPSGHRIAPHVSCLEGVAVFVAAHMRHVEIAGREEAVVLSVGRCVVFATAELPGGLGCQHAQQSMQKPAACALPAQARLLQ